MPHSRQRNRRETGGLAGCPPFSCSRPGSASARRASSRLRCASMASRLRRQPCRPRGRTARRCSPLPCGRAAAPAFGSGSYLHCRECESPRRSLATRALFDCDRNHGGPQANGMGCSQLTCGRRRRFRSVADHAALARMRVASPDRRTHSPTGAAASAVHDGAAGRRWPTSAGESPSPDLSRGKLGALACGRRG